MGTLGEAAKPPGSSCRRLFRNRTLLALWSGQAVSTVGDVFFNVAAMWVVYTQSHSTLQTAVIQAIWHLPSILLGPLAGAWVDRWDRKRVMVVTNVLSALVVGAVAARMPAQGHLSPVAIFVAIFLLNSLNTFFGPARYSVLPQVVGRDLLATAAGLSMIVQQGANFLGAALAGAVIAAVGAAWAVAPTAAMRSPSSSRHWPSWPSPYRPGRSRPPPEKSARPCGARLPAAGGRSPACRSSGPWSS